MNNSDPKQQVEQYLPELLERHPAIQAVYLFGSCAREDTHPASDIDLAVLAHPPLSPTQLWETAQHLASRIGRDVDLIDLSQATTVMQSQIITSGKRLYCNDHNACEEFEDRVYSSYARLNEERAAILADIAQRGNIHG